MVRKGLDTVSGTEFVSPRADAGIVASFIVFTEPEFLVTKHVYHDVDTVDSSAYSYSICVMLWLSPAGT